MPKNNKNGDRIGGQTKTLLLLESSKYLHNEWECVTKICHEKFSNDSYNANEILLKVKRWKRPSWVGLRTTQCTDHCVSKYRLHPIKVFTRIFNLADFSDQTALSLIFLTGLFECILFVASHVVLPGRNNIMYQLIPYHMKFLHHSMVRRLFCSCARLINEI